MKRLEFLFDYASPWSYLASELLPRKLPNIEVEYRPIYLRGLESFAKGLPYNAQKLAYIGRDYLRCSAFEDVATQMPAVFPINGLYALRGALFAIEHGGFAAYHRAMFRAAWHDGRDVSSKDVVLAVAAEAGQDAAAFARGLDEPAIKERLKMDTASAQSRGVFGVPSFFVGEELFWGHDRLDYVGRALTR
jgi:2-hydroxychromene-2-carboxylate isomerase